MYQSNQPITDEGFRAYRDITISMLAAGRLSIDAITDRPAQKPYAAAVAHDLIGEMADFITETGTGTIDDLLLRFSREQIDANLEKARNLANQRFTKRAA